MKLNIGCGHTKNEGYVNIDVDPNVKPDLVFKIGSAELPYGKGSIDEVTMLHTIEHVRRDEHPVVFGEINRVLKIGGTLIVAYPDAEKVLHSFLENKQGQRYSYWELAVYGRGNTIWDLHKCLILTRDFVPFLAEYGFGRFKVITEAGQAHNTVVQAVKTFNTVERTELLRREVLNDAS